MSPSGNDLSSAGSEFLPRLGIVTALANECASVEAFMDEVLKYLQLDDRWFLILDSVSKDGTRYIVEARSKSDQRLVYIWAPQNRCLLLSSR